MARSSVNKQGDVTTSAEESAGPEQDMRDVYYLHKDQNTTWYQGSMIGKGNCKPLFHRQNIRRSRKSLGKVNGSHKQKKYLSFIYTEASNKMTFPNNVSSLNKL